jgi:hypothetical protein
MQTLFSHSGYGYSKRLCENVSLWFLRKFEFENALIDIIHRGLKRENAYGFCDCTQPNDVYLITIELDTHMTKELYTKTLLHELTHARQWVEGFLSVEEGKLCYCKEPVENYDYKHQPHEIEAREQEQLLYHEYMLSSIGTVSEVAQ